MLGIGYVNYAVFKIWKNLFIRFQVTMNGFTNFLQIMKTVIFLSCVSLLCSEGIPESLKQKMRQAHSFQDVLEDIHLIYHPQKTNSHLQKQFSKNVVAPQPVRIMSGSLTRMHSRPATTDIDSHTADQLSLFGSIRQGNDTCQLQSVCVPVPVQNDDPQVVIFPKCYEVMQCVGSCCESFEKCHPHSIRKIQKPIIELLYVGNDRFMLNATLNITMEEHTSCSCYDCGPNARQCEDGYILGPSCKCECANIADRNNCLGNRFWNENSCSCTCENVKCPKSNFLDKETCECKPKKKVHLKVVTNSQLEDNSTPSDFKDTRLAEIASLPKLKAKIVSHNSRN